MEKRTSSLEGLEIMVNKNFWRNKKVFITGNTGFKGSWLSLWLHYLGAEVTGYALAAPTTPSLFKLAKLESQIHWVEGNIQDINKLEKSLIQSQAEIIIHMAAQPLVRESYINPVETYATNVMGTVNVLEAARKVKNLHAIVNVTTDKCYENQEWCWAYRENEPMGGFDPYSSSKGCSELVTAAYRRSFFSSDTYGKTHTVALATARAGNVIGGGDYAKDRLIPDLLKSISNNEKLIIRSPYSIRPWQHVLEPLSGYLILAEKLYTEGSKYADAWNFGPDENDAKNVEWIVKKFCENIKTSAGYEIKKDEQYHEATYLKLDTSKARQYLQWQPNWNLDIAIEKIIEWHNNSQDIGQIQANTIKQIQDYMSDN